MNGTQLRRVISTVIVLGAALWWLASSGIPQTLIAEPGVTLPPGPTPLPTARDPLYPDLVVEPLADFLVATSEAGTVKLRFTASIANVGPGPLWLRAHRSGTGTDAWQLSQRLADRSSGFSERTIAGVMSFGGHGHEHWHVRSGASYTLTPVAGDDDSRSQTKAGFCFFDQVRVRPALSGSPPESVFHHEACGARNAVESEMGMSVGWADPYLWQLADQEVNITGLPVGRYRVEATADPDGWFEESDETNNGTWAIVELYDSDGLMAVRVIELAPAP
jgi:hypothetical protein